MTQISVNLSDTCRTQMKQDKQNFSVTFSWREKYGAQPITSNIVHLIMVDMCFS